MSIEQERRVLDAYKTKVARTKRKLARQRSLGKNASSGANLSQVDTRRLSLNGGNNNGQAGLSNININRDLYKICTPDNKVSLLNWVNQIAVSMCLILIFGSI